jgi:toxin ParE1/3/4
VTRPVYWSEGARDDFNGILDYLAARSPAAARRILKAIDQTAIDLGEIPIGRPGRVLHTFERVVARTPYIIAYTIDRKGEAGDTIMILRVIHAARGWTSHH